MNFFLENLRNPARNRVAGLMRQFRPGQVYSRSTSMSYVSGMQYVVVATAPGLGSDDGHRIGPLDSAPWVGGQLHNLDASVGTDHANSMANRLP